MPGLQLEMLKASTAGEIDAAFETLVQHKASAVIVGSDPFLTPRARQFAVLAARNNIVMVTGTRDFTMAGCMISAMKRVCHSENRVGAAFSLFVATRRSCENIVECRRWLRLRRRKPALDSD
jgi:hypothetical protein